MASSSSKLETKARLVAEVEKIAMEAAANSGGTSMAIKTKSTKSDQIELAFQEQVLEEYKKSRPRSAWLAVYQPNLPFVTEHVVTIPKIKPIGTAAQKLRFELPRNGQLINDAKLQVKVPPVTLGSSTNTGKRVEVVDGIVPDTYFIQLDISSSHDLWSDPDTTYTLSFTPNQNVGSIKILGEYDDNYYNTLNFNSQITSLTHDHLFLLPPGPNQEIVQTDLSANIPFDISLGFSLSYPGLKQQRLVIEIGYDNSSTTQIDFTTDTLPPFGQWTATDPYPLPPFGQFTTSTGPNVVDGFELRQNDIPGELTVENRYYDISLFNQDQVFHLTDISFNSVLDSTGIFYDDGSINTHFDKNFKIVRHVRLAAPFRMSFGVIYLMRLGFQQIGRGSYRFKLTRVLSYTDTSGTVVDLSGYTADFDNYQITQIGGSVNTSLDDLMLRNTRLVDGSNNQVEIVSASTAHWSSDIMQGDTDADVSLVELEATTDHYGGYVWGLGHHMIDRVDLLYNDRVIQTMSNAGYALHLYEHLARRGRQAKSLFQPENVTIQELAEMSSRENTLFVNLGLFFSKGGQGNALPIAKLDRSSRLAVEVTVKSTDQLTWSLPQAPASGQEISVADSTALKATFSYNDCEFHLVSEHVTVSDYESEWLSNMKLPHFMTSRNLIVIDLPFDNNGEALFDDNKVATPILSVACAVDNPNRLINGVSNTQAPLSIPDIGVNNAKLFSRRPLQGSDTSMCDVYEFPRSFPYTDASGVTQYAGVRQYSTEAASAHHAIFLPRNPFDYRHAEATTSWPGYKQVEALTRLDLRLGPSENKMISDYERLEMDFFDEHMPSRCAQRMLPDGLYLFSFAEDLSDTADHGSGVLDFETKGRITIRARTNVPALQKPKLRVYIDTLERIMIKGGKLSKQLK